MASPAIMISEFVFTNRAATEIALVLEPEGDVIQVPAGKTCEIRAEEFTDTPSSCEFELAPEGYLTLWVAIVKQVYVDGVRVR